MLNYNMIAEVCRIVLISRGVKRFTRSCDNFSLAYDDYIYQFSKKEANVDFRNREDIARLFISKLDQLSKKKHKRKNKI